MAAGKKILRSPEKSRRTGDFHFQWSVSGRLPGAAFPDEGILKAFLSDIGLRAVSRIDGGIRGQREQIIPDTFGEFFVIAEGEIRSAHRAVEEAVAREDAFCVRKVEGDAAWRMTGSGKNFKMERTDGIFPVREILFPEFGNPG